MILVNFLIYEENFLFFFICVIQYTHVLMFDWGEQEERHHHGAEPAGRTLLGRRAQRVGGLVPGKIRPGKIQLQTNIFCRFLDLRWNLRVMN